MDQNTIPAKVVNDIASLKKLGWEAGKILHHLLINPQDYGKHTSAELMPLITPPKPKPPFWKTGKHPAGCGNPKPKKFKSRVNVWHLADDLRPQLLAAIANMGLEHLVDEGDSTEQMIQKVAEGIMDGQDVTEDDVASMIEEEMGAAR